MALSPEAEQFFCDLSTISDHVGWHHASPLTVTEGRQGDCWRDVTHVTSDEHEARLAVAIWRDANGEIGRAVYDFGTGDYLSWPSDSTDRDDVMLTDQLGRPRALTLEIMAHLAACTATGRAVLTERPSFSQRAIAFSVAHPEVFSRDL